MKPLWLTHTDTRMHRVRCDVPTEDGNWLENVYEHFVLRRFYLWGRLPIWSRELEVERRPIHEFIKGCLGS